MKTQPLSASLSGLHFGLRSRILLLSLAAFFLGSLSSACSDDKGSGSFSRQEDLAISVNPSTISFSVVATGGEDSQVVTVRHAGTEGSLRLTKIYIETESDDFSIGNIEKTRLEPSETSQITVHYHPTSSRVLQNSLVIETNIGSTSGFVTRYVPIFTTAGSDTLGILPNPINFGGVEIGDTKTMTPSLFNLSVNTITVTDMKVLHGLTGEYFSVSPELSFPFEIEGSETHAFPLSFTPTQADAVQAHLKVSYSVLGQDYESSPTLLQGSGEGPILVANPDPVDFGYRALEVAHEKTVTLSNQGSRPLVISKLSLSEDASPTISIEGFPEEESTLQRGEVLSFKVIFKPSSEMGVSIHPIASLLFETNEAERGGESVVHVFGRPETPVLLVNPPELIDFAFVAQSFTNERTVSLFNGGSAPLKVHAIYFSEDTSDEYTVATRFNWGPFQDPPVIETIQPNESFAFELGFTNNGPDHGVEWGKLIIESNDGEKPLYELNLKATRAGAPSCDIAFVPDRLDFGTVARGYSKTMSLSMVNQGSAPCSFHSSLVNKCSSLLDITQGTCSSPLNVPQLDGDSPYFEVTKTPFAIQNGLRPGQAETIEVTFTPPLSAPLIGDDMASYLGLLAVRVLPYGVTSPADFVYFPEKTGNVYRPNIRAKSGIAQLAVLPGELDFGMTTIGCSSPNLGMTAYNVGTASLDVTDIKLQGCSPEYQIVRAPGLPQTLSLNGSLEIEIAYLPQDESQDNCGVAFYTNDEDSPTIVAPIWAKGTYETEHTDIYTQTSGQDVDILFVIDNSGSMSEEQQNLKNNFQDFIQVASTWNNDYQIGVTSTDLENDAGRLLSARGNPRFVTSDNWEAFRDNANLGTNGSPDEKGLATAQAALSLPNTSDTQEACTNNSDCTEPDLCVDGICGGANRGFIRPNAVLEVVIVSDEEDSSPGELDFYENFFRNIKGQYNTNMFHLHAIVGDVPSGCSSQAGSADPGHRYVELARRLGGVSASICDASFSDALEAIGDIAFGLRRQFFLARIPDPSTLTVTVAGRACGSQNGQNWRYEEANHSVVFKEDGQCMPVAGEEVKIHYQTLCL